MSKPVFHAASWAGRHILVVEDDTGLREEICQFLAGNGMRVEMASDIAGARAELERHAFDLVLLDLWLNQESGFELLYDLRKGRNTPCIIMTAQDNVADKAGPIANGASDYILKPINPRELLSRIARFCGPHKKSRPRAPQAFFQDRSGAVSIVAALSMALMLAVAAIVIDVGVLYFARRNLQSTTDAAALAAVQDPGNASAIAASVFSSNGYSGQTLTVTPGTYTPNEQLTAQNRFAASATGINAVQVHASLQQKTYFGGVFGLGAQTLVTQATAARVPTVSFGAGTALATLNAGLLNSVLGTMWGTSLSLTLVDYQALAQSNIQALPFLNQLATNVGVTGSYQQLASTSITEAQLLTALMETIQSSGATGDSGDAYLAIQAIAAKIGSGGSLQLSNVISLAPLQGRTIGDVTASDPSLQLNLMSLLAASARTVAGGRLINIGTSLTIPVTNSSIITRVAVGSQMVQAAMATPGTTINTAQVRMALVVTLASIDIAGLLTTTIQVPLYLEAASGQATLESIPCTANGDRAQISASSGLTTLRFGTVTDAVLQNFSVPVTPVSTPIISTTLATLPFQVTISGSATVAASGPSTLDFTQTDINNATLQSVPSGAATPFTLLSTSFALATNLAGNPLLSATLNSLLSALNPLVASLIAPLDGPVSEILATFGLALGVTDVQVFDVSCRTPTLVG